MELIVDDLPLRPKGARVGDDWPEFRELGRKRAEAGDALDLWNRARAGEGPGSGPSRPVEGRVGVGVSELPKPDILEDEVLMRMELGVVGARDELEAAASPCIDDFSFCKCDMGNRGAGGLDLRRLRRKMVLLRIGWVFVGGGGVRWSAVLSSDLDDSESRWSGRAKVVSASSFSVGALDRDDLGRLGSWRAAACLPFVEGWRPNVLRRSFFEPSSSFFDCSPDRPRRPVSFSRDGRFCGPISMVGAVVMMSGAVDQSERPRQVRGGGLGEAEPTYGVVPEEASRPGPVASPWPTAGNPRHYGTGA